ncbi:MAG TPA: HNH endonuclease [Chloroflexota bacterium]
MRDPALPAIRIDRVRKSLLELGRRHECETCGLGTLWRSKALVLQVDHINGLHHDYRPENLRFLCPNCHSQTVNFAVRNRAYAEVVERQTRTA